MDDEADILKRLGRIGEATKDVAPTDAFAGDLMDRIAAAAAATSQLTDEAEGIDPEERLERISTSTEDLAAPAGLSDDVEKLIALEALGQRTSSLATPASFTDDVMSRIENVAAEKPAANSNVTRTARPVLFLAAALAAASVLFSWYTERNVTKNGEARAVAGAIAPEEAE